MSAVEKRISELGLTLPVVRPPVGTYLSARRSGSVVYVSGHGPRSAEGELITGLVGTEVDVETARRVARYAALNCLAALKLEVGSLENVTGILSVFGMVLGAPGFAEHPKVIDAASDLLVEIFGEAGKHSRSAVGMGSLPVNISVELEMVVEVKN